jgi:hypothetical protein
MSYAVRIVWRMMQPWHVPCDAHACVVSCAAGGVPCDVTLQLSCGVKMPAVGLLLTMASPFFRETLQDMQGTAPIPVSRRRLGVLCVRSAVWLWLTNISVPHDPFPSGGRQPRHVEIHSVRPLPSAQPSCAHPGHRPHAAAGGAQVRWPFGAKHESCSTAGRARLHAPQLAHHHAPQPSPDSHPVDCRYNFTKLLTRLLAFVKEQSEARGALSHEPSPPDSYIITWLALAEQLQLDELHELCIGELHSMSRKELDIAITEEVEVGADQRKKRVVRKAVMALGHDLLGELLAITAHDHR